MPTNYPVLIVTFARLDGLERLVSSGLAAGIRDFYVAIDGPRNEAHKNLQKQMQIYLDDMRERHGINIHVWHRDKNLGAAVSVLTAINWFFSKEEAGFILEDDLELSKDFFPFATRALNSYKDNSDVWLIAGSRMIQEDLNPINSEWSHYPMIWGWATWATKWKEMYRNLIEIEDPRFRDFFQKRSNFWFVGASRSKRGLIDAWDIPLAYAQFRTRKFTVIPPVNLVTNIGFDSNATHTSGDFYPLNHPHSTLMANMSLSTTFSHTKADAYDKNLDSKLFKIKFWHAFLRLYRPFLDILKSRKMNLGSLALRVNKVTLPE